MAPRLPFDHALPLVARTAFERNGAKVAAGDRVVVASRLEAAALWQALLVDCAPATPPAPAAVETLPVAPPPAKLKPRARAGA